MKYFISDLHLFSEETMKVYMRPFRCVDEEFDVLLRNINSRVTAADDLYFVGDFFDYDSARKETYEETYSVIHQFNGNKHLILGNNEIRLRNEKFKSDGEFQSWLIKGGFKSVTEKLRKVDMQGNSFYLTHRPEECIETAINIYGHVHWLGKVSKLGVNVSCDMTHFCPLSEDDIYDIIYECCDYIWKTHSTYCVLRYNEQRTWMWYLKHKTGKQYKI